jgi:putative transposase
LLGEEGWRLMTATLDDVENGKRAQRSAEQLAAAELVRLAKEQGLSLTGPDGLLKQLTKTVLETSLNEEMTEHLGYEKHDPAGAGTGNIRNGTRGKTVLTEHSGPVDVDVPRDRAGTFTPQIVRKRQRRLSGVDEVVLSLYAKGLTTGEISAHFAEIYGASVSRETISRITDKVVEEMNDWAVRPLDAIYAAIFIDAIVVKVRDGQVANRPFYAAIGVTLEGERDILGLWAGTGSEGAKFWMSVLTDLKNRGVKDVFFVVCDGLKGLPEVVGNVWPAAIVQTSSVHHGGGGIVSPVTGTAPGRTYANATPSRDTRRPVRPGRWRASHLPAGAAPVSAEMRFRRSRPHRGDQPVEGAHRVSGCDKPTGRAYVRRRRLGRQLSPAVPAKPGWNCSTTTQDPSRCRRVLRVGPAADQHTVAGKGCHRTSRRDSR